MEAPWFYGVYTAIVLAGALAVALIPNLVTLDIAVEVMNAFLLPLVLGFLVALSVKALPKEHRISGWYPSERRGSLRGAILCLRRPTADRKSSRA